MKLRSISLTDVRRFAGTTARADGLGDGLNVIVAPNEAGKPTFFDALQALFFLPARSAGSEAKTLRPYAGGAPEVEAEVELNGARYVIAKRWLSRPFARVTELRSDRVLAQDDAAECWIRDRIAGAGGGPAELLWVRQGMLALEPDGRNPSEKAEQERLLALRRDLLSSVAAEIDTITGGRRLDAIASRCHAALGEIATATGKPKAGGPWKAAVEETCALRDTFADLDAKCDELAAALAERAEVRAELGRAMDRGAADAQARALAEAERAAEAAHLHMTKLAAARETQRAEALELAAAVEAVEKHDRTIRRRVAAEETAVAVRIARLAAADALVSARGGDAAAVAAVSEASAAHDRARQSFETAERAGRARAAADRAATLGARLERATMLSVTAEAATAEARAAAASDADVSAARDAAAVLERARARAEAGAVTVAVEYLPGVSDRLSVDGRMLDADMSVACSEPTTIELPGIGVLTLSVGADVAAAAREAAEAEASLRAILAPAGAGDLAALAALAKRRSVAEARAAEARAELAGLAPDGIAALEAETIRLRAEAAGSAGEAPDLAAAAEAEAAARTALEEREGARAAAREAHLSAAHIDTTAQEKLDAAVQELAASAGDAAALPDRADLAARLACRRETSAAAERSATELKRAMPDAAAADATLVKAKSALRDALHARHQLETRVARLDAQIGARSEEGVEELRDEIRGRLEEAEARAGAYSAEARALARLHAALAAARADARDRYLAPVTAELAPLLGLVLDRAEVRMHPIRLLPEALARDGLEEDLAGLSGGTREQLAILTRLAFARLLARSGRATPVILDDALVFADDARMERMCGAIGQVASEVQVIVLTCRERTFSALSGNRPTLTAEVPEVGSVAALRG